jgi:hypothetical protein
MRLKLTNSEVQSCLGGEGQEFPKYSTQIINLANQNAQGTRPRVVGQLSDLIGEFPGTTLAEWQHWYLSRYPDAIEDASTRIYSMIGQLCVALEQIDEAMVRRWVEDLILVKTYVGLRYQEAILKKVAEQKTLDYRFSTSDEEGRGIDGYIGEIPVSIKPESYRSQSQLLSEHIGVGIIFYTKQKNGIVLDYDF